jgi:hypothetical protein
MAYGGGGGAGKVEMQDFHFTMKANKALRRSCCGVPAASTSRMRGCTHARLARHHRPS